MILLVSEHKKEIEPLLRLYPFEKIGKLLKYKNLCIFINYGRGALSLSYNIVQILSKHSDINISVLLGISGSLNNSLNVGDFFVVDRVKLMHEKKPISNPIDMPHIEGVKKAQGVTLFDAYDCDSEYLGLFADSVDKESYFFAKALKSIDKFGFVLRVISDNNGCEEVKKLINGHFSYDVNFLSDIVEKLMHIDKDEIGLEIFRYTHILNTKIAEGIKKLVSKKRLTFSLRQKLYKRIAVNSAKPKLCVNSGKIAVFVEKNVDRKRIRLNLSQFKVYEVNDYVGCFHNLKDRSGAIFANKKGEFLRKTPEDYTPEGTYGYSVLNAYNCLYDCSYCFLKGYFKSFNPVIFLNYEDYFDAVCDVLSKDRSRPLYFYAGTFSDSLSMAHFSDFNLKLAEFFGKLDDDVYLELRTKSDNIKELLSMEAYKNIIIAFSLNPQEVIDRYEHLSPSLQKRMEAIQRLDEKGFQIGIRIDPVFVEYAKRYSCLAENIKKIRNLHSVEIGFLRFDKKDYAEVLKNNPYILRNLVYSEGMYRYPKERRTEVLNLFKKTLGGFYTSME